MKITTLVAWWIVSLSHTPQHEFGDMEIEFQNIAKK